MSTTQVIPHPTDPVTFWQSTNGKKVVMAVTGVMMFGFVVGHMLGNLQMFEAPEHINAYGHFLHNLGELLWIERGVLLLAIALHITATVQLALRSKAARPVGYSRREAINSSYASRTMYWSGPIVLVFIIFHLLQFTAATFTLTQPSSPAMSTKTWSPGSRCGGFQPGISSPSACSVFT